MDEDGNENDNEVEDDEDKVRNRYELAWPNSVAACLFILSVLQ